MVETFSGFLCFILPSYLPCLAIFSLDGAVLMMISFILKYTFLQYTYIVYFIQTFFWQLYVHASKVLCFLVEPMIIEGPTYLTSDTMQTNDKNLKNYLLVQPKQKAKNSGLLKINTKVKIYQKIIPSVLVVVER